MLSGCLLLGLILYFVRPREPRIYAKATSYKAPGSERTLEIRPWVENEPGGTPGWGFVLISPGEEERLLERTHALAGGAVTQVDWRGGTVTVHTRAPMGILTFSV